MHESVNRQTIMMINACSIELVSRPISIDEFPEMVAILARCIGICEIIIREIAMVEELDCHARLFFLLVPRYVHNKVMIE